MFQLGEGGGTNKYRLRNTSLTAIHNITSYVKVPMLGLSGPLAPLYVVCVCVSVILNVCLLV